MFKTEKEQQDFTAIWRMFDAAKEIRSNIGVMEAQADLEAWNKLWDLFHERHVTSMLQIEGEDEEDTENIRNDIVVKFERVEGGLQGQKMYNELIEFERQSLTFDWSGSPFAKNPNQTRYDDAHQYIAEAYINMGMDEIKYGDEVADPRYLEIGEDNIKKGISCFEDYFRACQSVNPCLLSYYIKYIEMFDIDKLKRLLHDIYLDRKKHDNGESATINWKLLTYDFLSDFLWPLFAYGEAEEIASVVISFRRYLPKPHYYKDIVDSCLGNE